MAPLEHAALLADGRGRRRRTAGAEIGSTGRRRVPISPARWRNASGTQLLGPPGRPLQEMRLAGTIGADEPRYRSTNRLSAQMVGRLCPCQRVDRLRRRPRRSAYLCDTRLRPLVALSMSPYRPNGERPDGHRRRPVCQAARRSSAVRKRSRRHRRPNWREGPRRAGGDLDGPRPSNRVDHARGPRGGSNPKATRRGLRRTPSSSVTRRTLSTAGEGAHMQMWRAGLVAEPELPLPVRARWSSAVFVTHLHADHIVDLANLFMGSWPTHMLDLYRTVARPGCRSLCSRPMPCARSPFPDAPTPGLRSIGRAARWARSRTTSTSASPTRGARTVADYDPRARDGGAP